MCWRTYFLRRMESQAKGTHYNICACARKEATEGWKKTRRYGRALHDTRILTCLTSGSWHVWHPGLGMHDTRVSDTRKRLTGLTAQEENNTDTCKGKEIQTEKVNIILKNISVHCFCTANQSSFFWTAYYTFFQRLFACIPIDKKFRLIPPFFFSHFLIYVLLTLQTTCCITFSASWDSFCTMKPSYKLPE